MLVLSSALGIILLWGFKCEKVFKLQIKIVRILSLGKYNVHTDAIFKKIKLLKVSDGLWIYKKALFFKVITIVDYYVGNN